MRDAFFFITFIILFLLDIVVVFLLLLLPLEGDSLRLILLLDVLDKFNELDAAIEIFGTDADADAISIPLRHLTQATAISSLIVLAVLSGLLPLSERIFNHFEVRLPFLEVLRVLLNRN